MHYLTYHETINGIDFYSTDLIFKYFSYYKNNKLYFSTETSTDKTEEVYFCRKSSFYEEIKTKLKLN